MKNRAPEMADEFKNLINLAKPNLIKSLQNLSKEQVHEIQKTFEEEIQVNSRK